MRCPRCGTEVYCLIEGVCETCKGIQNATEVAKAAYKAKNAPKRKQKGQHKLDANISLYLFYIAHNTDVLELNKKDFIVMGIPRTSVNYLIKILKKKNYITTVGKVGKQYYKPNRQWLIDIRNNASRIRGLI